MPSLIPRYTPNCPTCGSAMDTVEIEDQMFSLCVVCARRLSPTNERCGLTAEEWATSERLLRLALEG